MSDLLPFSDDFDVLVVIPTVATRSVLIPTLRRLAERLDGYRVRLVVARNPVDPTTAATSTEILHACVVPGGHLPSPDLEVIVYDADEPCGFSGAINRGLALAVGRLCSSPSGRVASLDRFQRRSGWSDGIPPVTVILNDDVVPAHGWLRGLVEAFSEPYIHLTGEVRDRDGATIVRPVEDYGRIGIVGPVSNCAAGAQVYIDEETDALIKALGPDRFAARWREDHVAPLRSTVFLSGFCTAFRRECLADLVTWDGPLPILYDERNYPIAGFEDNDLAHRADLHGWRAAIAVSTYLLHTGHQTFNAHFPDERFGFRNHERYLAKWRLTPGVSERLAAIYRVRFDVPFDLDLFRMSLASVCTIVDDVVILLTDEIGRITASDEWSEKVSGDVQALVMYERERGSEVALLSWAERWVGHRPGSRRPRVHVSRWRGDHNERDERNRAIELAETIGANWILSVDHDEAIEPRATRASFERLMRHPDPLIRAWDFSWVNHWGDQRTMNVSRPWGDAGTFTGGMRGFRMFRVITGETPRRIQSGTENGLHCGNIPLFCPVSIRTSGLRFRHFGYMRPQDRARKLERYRALDPNPDPNLIGGATYDHIVAEENQTMSAFYPVNGIGLHMLLHDARQAVDLGRHLTSLYGVVDRIVLVWTAAWAPEDRALLLDEALRYGPKPDGVGAERDGNLRPTMTLRAGLDLASLNPSSGPSGDMLRLADHFGAEWIHQPLDDDFATARNAGIDALHGTPGLGWAAFVDPDEFIPAEGFNALRRMAEATDAWGWLVRFRNLTGPGPDDFNISENVRMSRLDAERVMRLSGRVHEGFGVATRKVVESGRRNVIRVCPVEWTNQGLALSPEAMEAKLDRYKRITETILTQDPFNTQAWITLGLFYANEGATLAHLECLNRAMASAIHGEYLAHYEAGKLYLRLAQAAIAEAESRMGGHPDRKVAQAMLDFLDRAAQPVPRTGLVGAGLREGLTDAEALVRLPYWPGPPQDPGRDDATT